MATTTRTLRLAADETALVEREAKRLGVYEHGLLRAAIRFALGLPIKPDLRESFERASERSKGRV